MQIYKYNAERDRTGERKFDGSNDSKTILSDNVTQQNKCQNLSVIMCIYVFERKVGKDLTKIER